MNEYMLTSAIAKIQARFSNIYCDNCANSDDEGICCYCVRKSMMWTPSEDVAKELSEELFELFESGVK